MQGFPSSTRPTRLCASGVLGAHARYRPTNALLSVCAGEPPSLILAGFTRRLAPCSAVDSASSDSGGFRHRKRCGCPWMQCTSHGRLVARSVRWVVQKERLAPAGSPRAHVTSPLWCLLQLRPDSSCCPPVQLLSPQSLVGAPSLAHSEPRLRLFISRLPAATRPLSLPCIHSCCNPCIRS